MSKDKLIAWCQQWEESERSWGVRPEGCTLHLTPQDAKLWADKFLKAQHQRFLEHGGQGVPDEYTRQAGSPYQCEVGAAQWKRLNSSGGKKHCGIGMLPRPYPKPVDANASGPVWESVTSPSVAARTLEIPLSSKVYEDLVVAAAKLGKSPSDLVLELMLGFMKIMKDP